MQILLGFIVLESMHKSILFLFFYSVFFRYIIIIQFNLIYSFFWGPNSTSIVVWCLVKVLIHSNYSLCFGKEYNDRDISTRLLSYISKNMGVIVMLQFR